jgi:hypothetical protein
MRLDDLFGLVERRGMRIVWGDGGPALAGDTKEATPRLLRYLKLRREEIAARLRPAPAPAPAPERPAVECRWNTGLVGGHWFPENGWPVGAWWWRHAGETDWRPIPGTPGETQREPRFGPGDRGAAGEGSVRKPLAAVESGCSAGADGLSAKGN